MKHIHRAPLALLLVLSLLLISACSGGQTPAPVSSEQSDVAASEAVSSEPAAGSTSAEPVESSPPSEAPEEPVGGSLSAPPAPVEPEAVETVGGTEAVLTGVITGEIQQTISGVTGTRAGTAAERDALMKLLSSLKPETVSLIVAGNPLSDYTDQTLLSDEDTKTLVGLASALPTLGVFETLGNPTTGGILWSLYIEAGDQAARLSDDGFWLTAVIKGYPQAVVFDSTACKAASEKLGNFVSGQIAAAQGNILTLS